MHEKKLLIAVDLDDVLFDFLGYFFHWHNDKYGSSLQKQDMVFDKIWDAWGGTKEEATERIPLFWRETEILEIEPISGSFETLKKLETTHRFVVISARDAASSNKTKAWFGKYFPGIFEEITLGISDPMAHEKPMTKAELCKQLNANLLIDDQIVHAIECAKVGIRVLLFGNHPHNQSAVLPKTVVRVKDWDDVGRTLLPVN